MVGCTSLPNEQPKTAEAIVSVRAQSYYDDLLKGDNESVYGYFSPSYRAQYTFMAHFLKNPPRVKYSEARVLKVTCGDPDRCVAEIELTYTPNKSSPKGPYWPVTKVQPQTWVRMDGQWWVLPRR
jgi:hypothetical protein